MSPETWITAGASLGGAIVGASAIASMEVLRWRKDRKERWVERSMEGYLELLNSLVRLSDIVHQVADAAKEGTRRKGRRENDAMLLNRYLGAREQLVAAMHGCQLVSPASFMQGPLQRIRDDLTEVLPKFVEAINRAAAQKPNPATNAEVDRLVEIVSGRIEEARDYIVTEARLHLAP